MWFKFATKTHNNPGAFIEKNEKSKKSEIFFSLLREQNQKPTAEKKESKKGKSKKPNKKREETKENTSHSFNPKEQRTKTKTFCFFTHFFLLLFFGLKIVFTRSYFFFFLKPFLHIFYPHKKSLFSFVPLSLFIEWSGFNPLFFFFFLLNFFFLPPFGDFFTHIFCFTLQWRCNTFTLFYPYWAKLKHKFLYSPQPTRFFVLTTNPFYSVFFLFGFFYSVLYCPWAS